MSILLSLIHNNDPFIRLTVVTWIYEFLLLDSEWTVPYAKLLRALLPVYGDFEKEVATKARENELQQRRKELEESKRRMKDRKEQEALEKQIKQLEIQIARMKGALFLVYN